MKRRAKIALLLALAATPLLAQLVVQLSPKTIAAFEKYNATVKTEIDQRWQGKKSFLALDENPKAKQQVLAGELSVEQINGKPAEIYDGLIHDWRGDIFIPNRTPDQVVNLLEDFDRHKDIYPAVAQSRILQRDGHHITGFWQLRQKGVVPVVLDVTEEVSYQQLAPGKWKGEALARNIIEHVTGKFSSGKKFAPGEGHGYLWRIYSYWTLAVVQGGTIAECRTLSLSRDVPQGLAWAVGPYIEKTPRDSLASTLKQTRDALEK